MRGSDNGNFTMFVVYNAGVFCSMSLVVVDWLLVYTLCQIPKQRWAKFDAVSFRASRMRYGAISRIDLA